MEEIKGGITNLLWKLVHPSAPPVVLRVFGEKTDLVIDRDMEAHVLLHVSRAGFGSQVKASRIPRLIIDEMGIFAL